MFWNAPWYLTGIKYGFYAIIVLNVYIHLGPDDFERILKDVWKDIRTLALGSLAGDVVFGLLGAFLLLLVAAVSCFFWPLSVSYLLIRAGKTFWKRHTAAQHTHHLKTACS